ncbi:hypothetical protein BH11ACT3_BH11ACT3_18610 [soil metagenome]
MNIPKWLLPVIAILAALAVGVAAVLIGMRFAPPTPASAFVPADTETATVLAPIAADDGDDGHDEDGDGEDADLTPPPSDGPIAGDPPSTDDPSESEDPSASSPVGDREVAVEEEDPAATDTELLRLIDLVTVSPDLLAGLMRLGLGEHVDDPCAPDDGSAPADDCPGGLLGTVLYDEPLPPLWMNAAAWPQSHAEAHDIPTDRDFGELFCDPSPREEGTASLRIRATAPGTWSVAYWPTGRPDEAQTVDTTSSAQQAEDWFAEADDIEHGWYIAEHCLDLPNVEAGTAYTAVVSGSDAFGRTPPSITVLFNGDGTPQHPGLQLQPVGQNLLIATALHAADESVVTRAYLVTADTGTTCDPPDGSTYLSELTVIDDVAVDDAERNEQNAPAEFTLKAGVSYRVPEGATLLVCTRWFPGGDAPSWESEQADFESAAIVQTADRFVPVLKMVDFDARDDQRVDISMRVSTSEGLLCGDVTWTTGQSVDLTLCSELAGGGVTSAGGRLADRGFTGDLVVRTDASSGDRTSENTYFLPAGSGSCVGVCVAPATERFGIATIGGTVIVERSWQAGYQNGRADWFVGAVTSNAVDYVAPDAPQIETRVNWEYTEPTFSPYVSATIEIPVDRQVDWSLRSIGNVYGGVSGQPCGPDAAYPSASGSSVGGVITIRLAELCLGAAYYPTLTLTDADGNVAEYAVADRSPAATWWGDAGIMTVPTFDVSLRYRVDVFAPTYSYIQKLDLYVTGHQAISNDYADPVGSRCSLDGVIKSEGSLDLSLPANVALGIDRIIVSQRYAGADGCAGHIVDDTSVPEVRTVLVSEIGGRDGILVTFSDGSHVHFWVTAR